MDVLRRRDLMDLTIGCDGPCVSIYMPTHVAGVDGQQNPIRLKNLLRQAEERMAAQGMRSVKTRDFLKPAGELLREEPFWGELSHGLALFISAGALRYWRVPLEFSESLTVSDRCYIKPLLPLLSGDDSFRMLALSQNAVRFFRGRRSGLEPLEVAALPKNLQQALNYDQPQEISQSHSAMQRTQGRPGKQTTVFHGQGGHADDTQHDLEAYCRVVDDALRKPLADQQAPLVLACVESLLPIYRKVNTYAHLTAQTVKGSPDRWSRSELHARGWPLVVEHLKSAQNAAADKFRHLVGNSKASSDVKEVVEASHRGRVDVLFVAVDAQQWGSFDPATGAVDVHPAEQAGDEDLLDSAAVQTLLSRGTIHAVNQHDMPADAPLAAIFRYAET